MKDQGEIKHEIPNNRRTASHIMFKLVVGNAIPTAVIPDDHLYCKKIKVDIKTMTLILEAFQGRPAYSFDYRVGIIICEVVLTQTTTTTTTQTTKRCSSY